jgi:hypothetical protein
MSDFFKNLVITKPPIRIADVNLSEQVLQGFVVRNISSQTSMEQTR